MSNVSTGWNVPMRRSDRVVLDEAEIAGILDACKVCNLAIPTDGAPYVVPLNFGYTLQKGALKLYFHSARQGRKVELLADKPQVGFAVSRETGELCADDPCHSGSYFESVLGSGQAYELTDAEEKCIALSALMRHQFDKDIAFTPAQAGTVRVFCIVAEAYCAKRKAKG